MEVFKPQRCRVFQSLGPVKVLGEEVAHVVFPWYPVNNQLVLVNPVLNKTQPDVHMSHAPKKPFHPGNLASRSTVRVDGEGLGEIAPDVRGQLT